MPAGPNIAPISFKENTLFQFRQSRALEQGEITRIVFLIVIEINCLPELDLAQVDAGQLAVFLELGDVKIDRAMFFIGITFMNQVMGNLDHVADVFGGQWITRGLLHTEDFSRLHELVDIFAGEIPVSYT